MSAPANAFARNLVGNIPGAPHRADRGVTTRGSLLGSGAGCRERPNPASRTHARTTSVARLRAQSRVGRSAQSGLKVTTAASRERPAGRRGTLRLPYADSYGGRSAAVDHLPAPRPVTARCDERSRLALFLADNTGARNRVFQLTMKLYPRKHGRSGRMGARPGGGGGGRTVGSSPAPAPAPIGGPSYYGPAS